MQKQFRSIGCSATAVALAMWAMGPQAQAAFTSGATYDEQAFQDNAVDAVAAAQSGAAFVIEGPVAAPSEYATFKADLSDAHAAGFGGVVHFDGLVQGLTDGTNVVASYAGGTKSLTVSLGSANASSWAITANLTNRKPISAGGNNPSRNNQPDGLPGAALSALAEPPGTITFAWGAPAGGLKHERVVKFGVAFLSRTSRNYGTVTATATFDDGSTAVTAASLTTAAATGDTFYGFDAGAERYLVKVVFTFTTSYGCSFDDMAFVTADRPPLPVTTLITLR